MRHDDGPMRQDRIGTEDLVDPGHAGQHDTADPRRDSGLTENHPDRDSLAADRAENSTERGGALDERSVNDRDDIPDRDAAREESLHDVAARDSGGTAAPEAEGAPGGFSDDGPGAVRAPERTDHTRTADTGAQADSAHTADTGTRAADSGARAESGRAAEANAGDGGARRRQAAPGERREDTTALFEDSDSERFRHRWHDVQAAFVDDPRRAVQDADQLVAELMQTLAATFAQRKRALEGQWQHGGDAETEDLRLALRSYRSFFDQLLPH